MQDDPIRETLSAFIDGELPPEEMARIALLLAERPDLDAWVRRQEGLRGAMKQAFSALPPAPARMVNTVRSAPLSWRWAMRRLARPRVWAPAAAALALGLVIGVALRPPSEFANRGGQLVARGALAHALNEQLASAGYAGSGPRIGISFRNRDGHYCRTFDADAQSGLACRSEKGWAVALLAARPHAETNSAYRMAGSEMPDAIRAAVQAEIQGAPFDAAAEKAARAHGWK